MISIKETPLKEHENQINNLDSLYNPTKHMEKLSEFDKIKSELKDLVKKLRNKS